MAGRHVTPRHATVFVQTPKVNDLHTQRALDAHHQAILDLQARRFLELFTATEDGYVPASGGAAFKFLAADGTWKTISGAGLVDSVMAGSSKVTCAPTTGAVIVDVVPANFTGIPESGVTNLTTDLAARPTGSGTGGRSTRWSAGTVLAAGAFVDDGTNVSLAGTLTLGTMTQNSVLFAGASGLVSQDNTNFTWNNTNKTLKVISTTSNPATHVVNADSTAGAMRIENTNVNGPVDFFAVDSAGVAQMSWGYGNASYSDTARAGRGYVWRNTGKAFVIARTNTVDVFIDSSGRVGIGTGTSLTGLLELNASTPDIFMNGATSALIRWSTNGAAAPTFTSRSAGTKLVLYPDISSSSSDYGIGIESGHVWFSCSGATAASGQGFKWYYGTTQLARLTGAGNFNVIGTLDATGDFKINTNKFTVTASNGNTLVAGTLNVTSDLNVNTNKFNVVASSGNTTVAGTLDVTGTTTLKGTAVICDGTGDTLKFYGGTGATQQTVTGSRGGNAALADLLTKLATLGIIVDGTSA